MGIIRKLTLIGLVYLLLGATNATPTFENTAASDVDIVKSTNQISSRILSTHTNVNSNDQNTTFKQQEVNSNHEYAEKKSLYIPNLPKLGGISDKRYYSSLPFTRHGHCEKGTVYTIKSFDDLRRYKDDLMCVMETGINIAVPPSGNSYGTVLDYLSDRSDADTEIINRIWNGKFSGTALCGKPINVLQPVFFGFNLVNGQFRFPSFWNITSLPPNCHMAPSEHPDDSTTLILDYMTNFNKVCPPQMPLNRPFFSTSETSNVCAIVKLVGQTSDGGFILLGRGLSMPSLVSNFSPVGLFTFIFFGLITYDPAVYNLSPGGTITLPPVPYSFDYNLVGIDSSSKTFRSPYPLGLDTLQPFETKVFSYSEVNSTDSSNSTSTTRRPRNNHKIKYSTNITELIPKFRTTNQIRN
ncbi:hypothetical protein cand_024260 [Cryptosporidium andersoni]|uniref:Uncharacterized protein n=1 Tax=Cryptosporidium andersoni TaxID=117008 RepID=A0A1J4MTS9_9CRYT|nr:hypothetical protein cand_024260 [Cryptosporidium andersoni]